MGAKDNTMNTEKMRTKFEAWWKQELLTNHENGYSKHYYLLQRSSQGDYVHDATAMRWEGWQAALTAKKEKIL
jgi:hypothetical protein